MKGKNDIKINYVKSDIFKNRKKFIKFKNYY